MKICNLKKYEEVHDILIVIRGTECVNKLIDITTKYDIRAIVVDKDRLLDAKTYLDLVSAIGNAPLRLSVVDDRYDDKYKVKYLAEVHAQLVTCFLSNGNRW